MKSYEDTPDRLVLSANYEGGCTGVEVRINDRMNVDEITALLRVLYGLPSAPRVTQSQPPPAPVDESLSATRVMPAPTRGHATVAPPPRDPRFERY